MTYRIAVRELCAFTAKTGDLDLRFTPAPTALEGMAGHATVAARRGSGYRTEVSLQGTYQHLLVRGRADGYDPEQGRLEEIKTIKGPLDRQPASHRTLHWAQARVYGWLLCQQEGLAALDIALVYYDITDERETVFSERWEAPALRAHFEAQCTRFLAWADQELSHRAARDAHLRTLPFPMPDFRAGQRDLAEAVYRAARRGRCLLAQAPTGIGKTLGTLYPLLRSMPATRPEDAGIDKLFYLAAKVSGRQLALDALLALQAPAAHSPSTGAAGLRVLELVARDAACEHPDKACHGDSCPLARGFYDRLPAARAAALGPAPADAPRPLLTQSAVRSVALAHGICPYYLTQELARWADVVVGDYHYYFDHSALLHGLTQANQWRVGLLVDEAHNLVDRARRMYTAELTPAALQQARRSPTATSVPALRRALDRVRRAWGALARAQAGDYTVFPDVPPALVHALRHCTGTLSGHFAEHPLLRDEALQAFQFEALRWLQLAEQFGEHALCDALRPPQARARDLPALCLRNVVPAPYLAPRLAAAHTSTLFSATLQPMPYYAHLLGLPADHATLEVAGPFAAAQLQVHVAQHLSTRYAHRQASLAPLVAVMARQWHAAPGNYLAFFSSYDYLQQAATQLAREHPHIPHWLQSRGMALAQQQAFLQRFSDTGAGIGFAVLGGAFSEGIDLPGRRLIGAFVATLGLPQINPVNEQMRQRMQALWGAGYDYTYLFPGLQKVVQAAGRVIRSPHDQGVLYLLDDRYARPEVQRLLPGWWAVPGAAPQDQGTQGSPNGLPP